MEARLIRTAALAALLLVSMGARYPSANFIVETSDPQMAQTIAQYAERYRHDLAIQWLGEAMPNWARPCQMTVQVAPNLGAGGATTFVFDHGEVFNWQMTIQGSAERVLDSVLPHEITHMIYASHFRRPLPRWADEGGATSVEHISERQKQRTFLVQFLRSNRGIAFNDMFAMTEYPSDIMPLYSQGYSLAEFLIYHGGRRRYVEFLGDGLDSGDWPAAVAKHYRFSDLGALQNSWLTWVSRGFPAPAADATAVAAAAPAPRSPARVLPVAAVVSAAPVAAAAGRYPSGPSIPAAAQSAAQAVPPPPAPSTAPPTAQTAVQPASAAEPVTSQVTHPQAMQPSRQIILEWSRP